MTRDEWIALAERCEAATGPDDRLDFAIDGLLFAPRLMRGFKARAPYTASLDAITALIERELPDYDYTCGKTNGGLTIHAQCGSHEMAFGSAPALALCGAFCRAMAEKAGA